MRRARALLTALALGLALAGCGSVSEEYDIAGIDELDIPTPSPDPADFVAEIDNPWLPYAVGNAWVYDVTVGITDSTMTVEVTEDTRTIAGVVTTAVDTTYATADTPGTVRDYYAQDRQGNVWWFGSEGSWEAGVDGAQAGLAMPADPRLGDGWRRAYLEGVVETKVTVEEVDGDTLVLRSETPLVPGEVVQEVYAAGVGLERTFNVEGAPRSSVLASGP
ncbi:hypothetical protein [Nocardioides sp.]|uniref:hypothetical protein n=1 Tax=Nocardioides sp. TaxID=35761 RepID=UPI001A212248|nr:hypothetical protein [Nocardioides sp.]MBJ7357326.1 hypothetical protein [Nocardioides sp.]